MNNKEYLTEDRYNKVIRYFIIKYTIMLLIGIAMIIGGIYLLIKFKEIEYFSIEQYAGCGLLLVGISLSIMSFGDLRKHAYSREMLAYKLQQQMPLAQETFEKLAPSIGKVAKEIKKGIKDE